MLMKKKGLQDLSFVNKKRCTILHDKNKKSIWYNDLQFFGGSVTRKELIKYEKNNIVICYLFALYKL